MSNLQTKNGVDVFKVVVEIEEAHIIKQGDEYIAVVDGEEVGQVTKAFVKGKAIKLASLTGGFDIAALMKKNPAEMSPEEIAALQAHLAEVAKGKIDVEDAEEAKEETKKEASKKTGKKTTKKKEESDEEEEAGEIKVEIELPEGIESIDDLNKMSAKALWKLAKPVAEELEVNSRTKKADFIEALAEYFDLEEADEEEELDVDDLPEDMDDDEEDYDDDEYEDDEEEADSDDEEDESEEEEDDEDSDEDEDDEEEDDEDEEEEEDEDDDEEEDEEDFDDDENEDGDIDLTPEDIDALDSKKEVVAIMKQYDIPFPKKKGLTLRNVREYIKQQLFGDK